MGTRDIFLDTSGWVAILNRADLLHARSDALWHELLRQGHKMVLTDWIIAETGNSLARTAARDHFPAALRQMLRSPRLRLVFVDRSLMERALTLYSNRPDKHWGLVDCASFVVMQDEGIKDAFATDSHFEQAGFHRLLPGANF
jgi:uncharacterized protein